ncbi:DUF2829 domain-containing protein [Listeria sp. PSOL-1]|uniref:DUF2829 domain-containing protein n=1 Tax=Listeria sp. PSOL-1 TaxID=1844999 RepID=UPI0013D1128A|nr:DUF2829 domain-containing protein [Listeria sp. PSOL-1]
MTFEAILPLLKKGEKVIRRGFFGKERYIILVEEKSFQGEEVLPYFLINVEDEGFAVYTPTVCDLLADDWEVVS